MRKFIRNIVNNFGYDIIKTPLNKHKEYDEFIDIYKECQDYTMTSIERMFSLYKSVEYVIKNDIAGDFIECGVWKGGSSMMIAKTLKKFSVSDRKIYLFDTFEGMNEPTQDDVNHNGVLAKEMLSKSKIEDSNSVWCYASLSEVTKNMKRTSYPDQNIIYIKGKVEDTLPGFDVPKNIALLRLDTDWYESTKMEMEILYPSITQNGILIIDDYGYWDGARKAIDEYFLKNKTNILLNRIDYTGRIAIKNL